MDNMDNCMGTEQERALRAAQTSNAAIEIIQKQAVQLGESFRLMAQAAENSVDALQHYVDRHEYYNEMYARYVDDGACYGECHHGFMQWLDDFYLLQHCQREIAHIKFKQDMGRAGQAIAEQKYAEQKAHMDQILSSFPVCPEPNGAVPEPAPIVTERPGSCTIEEPHPKEG